MVVLIVLPSTRLVTPSAGESEIRAEANLPAGVGVTTLPICPIVTPANGGAWRGGSVCTRDVS